MANLRDLRKRRKGAANTKKITRTMELVASAKLKRAQDAAAASRPYADGLRELVGNLAAASGGVSHRLMNKPKTVKNVVIMVATSDRGLCGAFNINLVNLAVARAKEHEAAGRTVTFIALGKKAASTLTFLKRPAAAVHVGAVGKTTYAIAERLAEEQMDSFLKLKADLVEVVYARFISAARQTPDHLVLLPAGGAEKPKGPVADVIFNDDPEELLSVIVPQMVKTALFSALLQTTAAEHAARRVAMKNATDAASDMVKSISSAYNRGRQSKITQEIAEIVGAVEAMA